MSELVNELFKVVEEKSFLVFKRQGVIEKIREISFNVLACETGTGIAKKDDKVLMVAYFPESKKAIYGISAAIRKDCKAILQMNSMKGMAETWMGFVNADETNAADSVYTGSFTL